MRQECLPKDADLNTRLNDLIVIENRNAFTLNNNWIGKKDGYYLIGVHIIGVSTTQTTGHTFLARILSETQYDDTYRVNIYYGDTQLTSGTANINLIWMKKETAIT